MFKGRLVIHKGDNSKFMLPFDTLEFTWKSGISRLGVSAPLPDQISAYEMAALLREFADTIERKDRGDE